MRCAMLIYAALSALTAELDQHQTGRNRHFENVGAIERRCITLRQSRTQKVKSLCLCLCMPSVSSEHRRRSSYAQASADAQAFCASRNSHTRAVVPFAGLLARHLVIDRPLTTLPQAQRARLPNADIVARTTSRQSEAAPRDSARPLVTILTGASTLRRAFPSLRPRPARRRPIVSSLPHRHPTLSSNAPTFSTSRSHRSHPWDRRGLARAIDATSLAQTAALGCFLIVSVHLRAVRLLVSRVAFPLHATRVALRGSRLISANRVAPFHTQLTQSIGVGHLLSWPRSRPAGFARDGICQVLASEFPDAISQDDLDPVCARTPSTPSNSLRSRAPFPHQRDPRCTRDPTNPGPVFPAQITRASRYG